MNYVYSVAAYWHQSEQSHCRSMLSLDFRLPKSSRPEKGQFNTQWDINMIYIQFDISLLFNTYDDFLFISMWSSTTLDIARMICAIILLTIICNVFVILFVYFFVGSGAAATFIPCPFSHGYRGCV